MIRDAILSRALLKAIPLLAVVGIGGWVAWSGSLAQLDLLTLQGQVHAAGMWGPAVFLALFAMLQPFGVSAYFFLVSAGMLWSPVVAIGLSWVGMMAAALVSFCFARFIARGWVQSRLPARLQRYDARLASDGLRTVLLLRLMFFTTFLMQLMLGVSQVRMRDYILGTAIGNLPLLVAVVLLSDRVALWLQ